jgi:hypothetical protein
MTKCKVVPPANVLGPGRLGTYLATTGICLLGLLIDVGAPTASAAAPPARSSAASVGVTMPASPYRYAVYGTASLGEYAKATEASTKEFVLPDANAVYVVCQQAGQGIGGSAVWDRLTNGGWVPDYYVSTPNIGVFTYPIPTCITPFHWSYSVEGIGQLPSRTGPSVADRVVRALVPGAVVDVVCLTTGSLIGTSRVWDDLLQHDYVPSYDLRGPEAALSIASVPRCPMILPASPAATLAQPAALPSGPALSAGCTLPARLGSPARALLSTAEVGQLVGEVMRFTGGSPVGTSAVECGWDGRPESGPATYDLSVTLSVSDRFPGAATSREVFDQDRSQPGVSDQAGVGQGAFFWPPLGSLQTLEVLVGNRTFQLATDGAVSAEAALRTSTVALARVVVTALARAGGMSVG